MRRLVLALLVALLVTAPAAAARSSQQLADQTAAWLSHTLRVEVPSQRIVQLPQEDGRAWAAQSVPGADPRIEADPWLAEEWTFMASSPLVSPDAAHALLHELLHLHRAESLEEGVVDAVALDLVGAWTGQFYGWGGMAQGYGDSLGDAAYPSEVREVRALSAAATDGRRRSHAARHWRRALLTADVDGRQAMIARARSAAAARE